MVVAKIIYLVIGDKITQQMFISSVPVLNKSRENLTMYTYKVI